MVENAKRTRKTSTEKKKRQILNAAVRVFAQKGFHRCRISDIAKEASVAYGLVYHYFENKEEILNSIFDENWGLLNKVIDNAAEQNTNLEKQLLTIVSVICDAYRLAPDIIHVMVIEIARSSKFLKTPKIETYEKTFSRLAGILRKHQEACEIDPESDPKFLAYCFFGMIELILTGYLLNTLQPEEGPAFEKMKSRLVNMFLNGIRIGAQTPLQKDQSK
ncbi:MAG: TetR/AcrR family transcriptional regulator [Deltaproteobacteria bacterium]|nr:TetR/AcrR family transcriptional regulator [Deltaproteobacteria bacterium]